MDNLKGLYEQLSRTYGQRADPATWWPVFFGRTDPPAFERVITNVLVTQSNWRIVLRAVEALDRAGFLTANALAEAEHEAVAACVRPTGFQDGKAATLQALGKRVVDDFRTEAAFCAMVSRELLLGIRGVGPETADRTLLYACGRITFPVDTYTLRVLAHHGVIPAVPQNASAKARVVEEIKRMVEEHIPRQLDAYQRLHALMQLEGEDLRRRTKPSRKA